MTELNIEYPNPDDFPEAEDFVLPEGEEHLHSKEFTGGPGGVVNYPEETWPEGFDPEADYASPKVEI